MEPNRIATRQAAAEDFEFLWRLQCEAMRPNVERQFDTLSPSESGAYSSYARGPTAKIIGAPNEAHEKISLTTV